MKHPPAVPATEKAAPPEELKLIAARVQVRLKQILDAERRQWVALDPSLDEPLGDLADMILGGGKRIRPAYCHWGWLLGTSSQDGDTRDGGHDPGLSFADTRDGGPHDGGPLDGDALDGGPHDGGALDGGCALEILHAFALAHDDVMDASPTRRGSPTVWRKFAERHRRRGWQGESRRFGEAAAVLVGDMAMVLADRTLGRATPEARAVWDALRTELNMGQYLDIAGSARGGATADQARRIIEHKTARYTVVRPLQLGAALAGRADLAESLARHGRPVGMAFQLRDDILGAFGDPAATGKPVGDDIREGKPTLLMALARQAATPAQQRLLRRAGPGINDETLTAVQQTILDTGALAQVEEEITALLQEALHALEALPDTPAAQNALAATARFAAQRTA